MDSIFKKRFYANFHVVVCCCYLTNVDRMFSRCDGRTDKQPLHFTYILKYLAELDLQGNVLTKLPDSVEEMEHLVSINLANNKLSIFPDKLTKIATLEWINLEGNNFTGNNDILMHAVCVLYDLVWAFGDCFFFKYLNPQKYQWRSCLPCLHWSGWTWSPTLWTQTPSVLWNLPSNLTFCLQWSPNALNNISPPIDCMLCALNYFIWTFVCLRDENTWRLAQCCTRIKKTEACKDGVPQLVITPCGSYFVLSVRITKRWSWYLDVMYPWTRNQFIFIQYLICFLFSTEIFVMTYLLLLIV